MLKRRGSALLAAGMFLFVSLQPMAGEAPDFAPADLDGLIKHSTLPREGTVEIVLQKISLDAEIVSPPAARRTQYLLDTLRNLGAEPVPAVSHGMEIKSAQGKTLNVYVEDTVAEKAKQELAPGRQVTLYGYHVYDSKKHGPGILVSGFEAHSRIDEWKERLGQWLHDQ